MRVLVYAAGVYALSIGCIEAFAPKSGVGGLSSVPRPAAGARSADKRTELVSMGMADDTADMMKRVDAMMGGGQSMHTVAASFEASYNSPASQGKRGDEPIDQQRVEDAATIMAQAQTQAGNGGAKSWSPPQGYTPGARASPADTSAVMARVSEMLGNSMTCAPADKPWSAPSAGYTPAPGHTSPTNTLSSAPASKWQPCTLIKLCG